MGPDRLHQREIGGFAGEAFALGAVANGHRLADTGAERARFGLASATEGSGGSSARLGFGLDRLTVDRLPVGPQGAGAEFRFGGFGRRTRRGEGREGCEKGSHQQGRGKMLLRHGKGR